MSIILVIIFSYQKNRPDLIRYIGKSTLTITYTTFFTLLFFCQEIRFTIIISFFMAILMITISKFIEMRNYEKYIYKKYIKNEQFPPKSSLGRIIRFQRIYYNIGLFLYIYPFLNLIFNILILLRFSYYNKSLLVSTFLIIILVLLPFYLKFFKCHSLYPKEILRQFQDKLRWYKYFDRI